MALEPELDTSLEAGVALTVVATSEVVAEAGQDITRIHDLDGVLFGRREVAAAAVEAKALLLGDFDTQTRPVILVQALA